MKRFLGCFAFLIVLATGISAADAAPRATPDEAKVMALKAAAVLREEGLQTAKAKFEDKNGEFIDRELHVFVFDRDHTVHAHGAMPQLDGKNLTDLRDPTGKLLMQEICAVKGEEWVSYVWKNPANNKVEQKKSYVIGVGDYVVGVGTYIE
jgi:cytochrome c